MLFLMAPKSPPKKSSKLSRLKFWHHDDDEDKGKAEASDNAKPTASADKSKTLVNKPKGPEGKSKVSEDKSKISEDKYHVLGDKSETSVDKPKALEDKPKEYFASKAPVKPTSADQLWDCAYDNLKRADPKLFELYEAIQSRELSGDSGSNDAVESDNGEKIEDIATDHLVRRQQMLRILGKGVENSQTSAKVEEKAMFAIDIVLSVKSAVDMGVESVPIAAVAWGGVCTALQVCHGSTHWIEQSWVPDSPLVINGGTLLNIALVYHKPTHRVRNCARRDRRGCLQDEMVH